MRVAGAVWLRHSLAESTVALWDSQIGAAKSRLSSAHLVLWRPASELLVVVVDRVTGPLAPRRAIGTALRQLREEADKNLQDVASDTLISRSKLSRLENAQGRPLLRDIRDLIRYYGIEGTPQASRLLRWIKDAQRPGWWTDFDVLLGTMRPS
jgi:hypothetical protein